MRINHNIAALNTYRQLGNANNAQLKSMEKLSSGLRINRAGDDAAGLAISEKMRAQIRGLDMASKNAQDGISLIQTAEGALNETHAILQRMRELAVQSANDTNTLDDRKELQKEVEQLKQEINRISTDTEFNTKKLLNGDLKLSGGGSPTPASATSTIDSGNSGSGNITITDPTTFTGTTGTWTITYDGTGYKLDKGVGDSQTLTLDSSNKVKIDGLELDFSGITANNGDKWTIEVTAASGGSGGTGGAIIHIGSNDGQSMTVDINEISSSTLGNVTVGYVADIDIESQTGADSAIKTLDEAIKQVSSERSKLGAFQNRLEHTINNLATSSENLTAAESRIRDVDMAKEMMEQTKNAILAQASQAMLAQANQLPQGVLQLLR